ncbi:MAG: hypothetical protein ACRC14_13480 [Paracoccaceae bacterium]
MAPAAMMLAMQAQNEAMMVQQMGQQMMQQQQTHMLKTIETGVQGERARENICEKLGNDFTADQANEGKQQHDSASSASAA